MNQAVNPLTVQYGGGHYKNLVIQPVEFCEINQLSFCQSSAIKYLTRYRLKNGFEDLSKAKHFVQLLRHMDFAEYRPVIKVASFTWNITPEQYCEDNNIGHKESAAITLICRFRTKIALDRAEKIIDELIEDCCQDLISTPEIERLKLIIHKQAAMNLIAKNRLDAWWCAAENADFEELRNKTAETIERLSKLGEEVRELV